MGCGLHQSGRRKSCSIHFSALLRVSLKLAETFTYAHTLYARDLDTLTKSLSASIEPVLMVVIGLAIGIVAFSVVSPMYSITSHLHGT